MIFKDQATTSTTAPAAETVSKRNGFLNTLRRRTTDRTAVEPHAAAVERLFEQYDTLKNSKRATG